MIEAKEKSAEPVGKERRQSFRLDMEKEPVNITWFDQIGQEFNKKIACIDFSKGGLKLSCDQSIAIHTEVTVVFKAAAANSQILNGRVIRCLNTQESTFEIALKLID